MTSEMGPISGLKDDWKGRREEGPPDDRLTKVAGGRAGLLMYESSFPFSIKFLRVAFLSQLNFYLLLSANKITSS